MSSKNHWCYQCWNQQANGWQPELFLGHKNEQAVFDAKEKFLEVSIRRKGVAKGGSTVPVTPPFASLFLTKQPKTGGENAMTISWP